LIGEGSVVKDIKRSGGDAVEVLFLERIIWRVCKIIENLQSPVPWPRYEVVFFRIQG
jgi:hypothetical protein